MARELAPKKPTKALWYLIGVFCLLIIVVITFRYYFYQSERRTSTAIKIQELAAIADLKVRQIVNWRHERLSDANFLARYSDLGFLTDRLLFNPQNRVARQRIHDVLNSMYLNQNYHYIAYWSHDGGLLVSIPPAIKSRYQEKPFKQAKRSGKIQFTDIFFEEKNRPALHIYVPIHYQKGEQEALVGIIQLAIDPEDNLFPFLRKLTAPSSSTEVVLLRSEKDCALILDASSSIQDAKFHQRVPLEDFNSIFYQAVVNKVTTIEGLDQRSVPVLAVAQSVPDTPWILVVKVDREEIEAPLRTRTRLEVYILILIIILCGVLLAFYWYQKQKSSELAYYRQQLEREALVKHFDYLAKYANDMIFLCDQDQHIIECNDRAREVLGYSREDLLDKNLADLIADEEYKQLNSIFHQISAQEGLVFETELIRSNGSSLPIEASMRQISIEGITYLQLIIRDITERKENERSLKASETRYRQLVDASPTAIIIIQNEEIVFANPAAVSLLAIPAEETLIGQSLERILVSERFQAIKQLIERMLGGETGVFQIEDYLVRWDGTTIPVAITAAPYTYEESPAIQLIAIDISEQFKDRIKIRHLNQQLFRLAQIIQQLTQAHKEEEVITLVTQAAAQLAYADGASFIIQKDDQCRYVAEQGLTPSLKGRTFPLDGCPAGRAILNRDLVIVPDMSQYQDASPTLLSSFHSIKGLVALPILSEPPHGAIEIYWSGQPEMDPDIRQTLQTLCDATHIALENAVAFTDLENRVAERTRQLEQANKELEAFSYSVSHDLRAPLRAIDGFAQMLHEDYSPQLPPEAQRLLGVIRSNVSKMSQLISDLLTFSRAGRKAIVKQLIDMRQLFNDVFEELIQSEPERKIDFILAELPPVEGDIALLRQVVANLLSNALKFTRPRAEAQIRVNFQKQSPYVIFSVTDNGVGFDMRYVDKVFGVFQRLHRDDEFEGTGLGLALVQRIIAKHDGKVWIQSEVGQGTTVYFSLLENPSITGDVG